MHSELHKWVGVGIFPESSLHHSAVKSTPVVRRGRKVRNLPEIVRPPKLVLTAPLASGPARIHAKGCSFLWSSS